MSPRRVTVNQLFLQPKVHRVWLLKHGSIKFDLPGPLVREFTTLWERYCATGQPPPSEFLAGEHLVDNDRLFALFASAIYLTQTLPEFYSHTGPDGIHWSAPPLRGR